MSLDLRCIVLLCTARRKLPSGENLGVPFPPGGAEGKRACEESAGGIMTTRAKPSGLYLTAIERFAETEECSPVELVAGRASVKEIAERFGKTPGAVAKDISRVDLESCKPIRDKRLHFLD